MMTTSKTKKIKMKDEIEIIIQQKNNTKHQSNENQNHHHEEEEEVAECIHPYMSLYTPVQLPQSNNDINNTTTGGGEGGEKEKDESLMDTTTTTTTTIKTTENKDETKNSDVVEATYHIPNYPQQQQNCIRQHQEEEEVEGLENGGGSNNDDDVQHSMDDHDNTVGGGGGGGNEEDYAVEMYNQYATTVLGEEGNSNDADLIKERRRRPEIKATTAIAAIAESAERMINDEGWSIRYYELVGYHTLNNHSNVLRSDPNKRLSGWVKRQRNNFKAGKLSYTQIMLLNELDFVWNRLEHGWYEKYKMICNYSKQISNGQNCNVPCSYNRQLSEWTQKQRRDYGKKEKSMTLTRIDALEKVPGWTWTNSQSQLCKQQQQVFFSNNSIKKVEQQQQSSSMMMMNIKNNSNQQQQQQHQSLENDIELSSDAEVDDVVI